MCQAGFVDCNANSADGCEINLVPDNSNCGLCGNICGPGHTCNQGLCVQTNPVCSGTFANCDGNPANGCETNLSTVDTDCGKCANRCPSGSRCSQGTCIPTTIACAYPFDNCDKNSANGCETNLATSLNNCGACGRFCGLLNATSACINAACAIGSCNAGYGNCDGDATNGCEINLGTDSANCGGCSNSCGNNVLCVNAQCVVPE